MRSLQEYIVEVSSNYIKAAADKAKSLSKEGPRKEQKFRAEQAQRLYDAYKKKLDEEEKERILKNNCPNTREELILILEARLAKDKNADLNDIDVSKVTDMGHLFHTLDPHNIKIDKWDVSNVKYMNSMFRACENFEVKNLNNWNVSKVIDMSCMFSRCHYFNADLSNWNVSNVRGMEFMFNECRQFNCNLNNWDVSKVTNMSCMFCGCEKFNGDISNWNVSNVIDMSDMFLGCEKFNGDLSNWDVSNVTNMSNMFFNCDDFEGKGLENWDISNVKNVTRIFDCCKSLKNKPSWYNNW